MRLLLYTLVLLGYLSAQLAFETTHLDATPSASESTYEVVYPFTVTENVTISRLKTACSCIAGTISPDKKEWKKGEEGSIKSTLDLSLIRGNQTKKLVILFADGKTQSLSVTINVPVALKSSPKSHKWKVGEETSSKTFEINILPEFDFEITDILVSNKQFDFELNPIEMDAGKKYELVVTPKDLSKKQICSFRLKTDAKAKRHQHITVLSLITE